MMNGAATSLGSALLLIAGLASGEPGAQPLLQKPWLEARTPHFTLYSSATTQEVAKVGARLEQFREAYSLLAGTQSVASPPIVVMVFPTHKELEPFLPVYQGKPANLAAFFHRGSDENLIALYAGGAGGGSLESVFHEYTHLLFRRNALFWPLWLNEGMADIYSTFEPLPDRAVRIGKPLDPYLRLLARRPLMPLADLLAVNHRSPEYNERDRQGIFYAQSWLLTHFLMLGDSPALKARFGQLTVLLKQGQSGEEAFTNAFKISLPQMESQLRRYLERNHFESLKLAVNTDLGAPRSFSTRLLPPVGAAFRLGDMLMRIGRSESAREYFELGRKMAPKSPLPHEGLGLLASERHQPTDAVIELGQALQLGSTSFLAHYANAREKYRLTSKTPDNYTRVGPETAAEIERDLRKSLELMPEFGPAHHLLGFFLMVQGNQLAEAEKQLQLAVQLEPENQSYLFALAQVQLRRDNPNAALKTLQPLRLTYVDPQLRQKASEMIQEIEKVSGRARK